MSSTTTPAASQDTVPSQSKPQVAKSNHNNIVVEVKDKEKDKPKAAAASGKASNKKDNNKSSAGQKSMMSFFGKK